MPDSIGESMFRFLSQPCTSDDTKTGHGICSENRCSCWCHGPFVEGLFPKREESDPAYD